jgi:hypothetical protein
MNEGAAASFMKIEAQETEVTARRRIMWFLYSFGNAVSPSSNSSFMCMSGPLTRHNSSARSGDLADTEYFLYFATGYLLQAPCFLYFFQIVIAFPQAQFLCGFYLNPGILFMQGAQDILTLF